MKMILVTGATGYIGGRLVPRLLEAGYPVRVLTRDRRRLEGRPWLPQVEVVEGDALDPNSLGRALEGVSAAYYLIHGRQGDQTSAERELLTACNFAREAEHAGLERILYLGELANPAAGLSPYLRGRRETGNLLKAGRVPVTEFRAGMVIGSGSALFEMIRYVAERQPFFICPRWWFSLAQPIAIRDALAYLVEALAVPASIGQTIEIGGADRLTYAEMLQRYCRLRGLRRLLLPVPFYAPRLSAYWVHMVTPVHWRVVLPLIEGLHADLVVSDDLAHRLFPHIRPLDFETALRLALGRVQSDDVETSWMDALVVTQGDARPVTLTTTEGMILETRRLLLEIPAPFVFRAYTGLGGERGWLYLNWTWQIRGWIDKLFGGVGLRRGRRHPDELRVGEALDFWRVEAVEPERLLRLRAEMKVPGKAWLEFRSLPQSNGKTLLTQTAYFAPRGLAGLFYWYLLYPIHAFIFSGMIRQVGKRARLLMLGRDWPPIRKKLP
ncbi:MAG: SDR family oxidoreductase [Anaerolineales bacterium]|nr:SDR family oxidoreductase [Anaerolineales bacterium]